MKKLFVLIFIILDVCLITICINLYNVYVNDNNEYILKLDGNNYEDLVSLKEDEIKDIINDIENDTGYELDDNTSFEDIKNKLDDDYNKLVNINNDLFKKKEQLTTQNNNLQLAYNKILEEERKKNTYMINNVPKINQYSYGYPTGCESAALTSLLKFWGVSVSLNEVVNVLPKGILPYYENGIRYGGNPYLEFIGHPSSSSSYGVYEKPIMGVANNFKSGIIDGTGMSLNEVLGIVKEGRPVMVWVSMNMAVPYISKTWIYKNTGERISWMANEHALLVIGYNPSQVIVADSLNGKVRYYDKGVFESRYRTFGKRALYY